MFFRFSKNSTSQNFWAGVVLIAVLAMGSSVAEAQQYTQGNADVDSSTVVPGCDPRHMEAQKAKGDVKVAQDVAATEEIVTRPHSVLAMTCFDKAAEVSAENAGTIFSGNFWGQTNHMVESGLNAHFQNFRLENGSDLDNGDFYKVLDLSNLEDAVDVNVDVDVDVGLDVGIGPGGVVPGPVVKDFECDAMNKVWDSASKKGVNNKTPYMGEADLETCTPPPGAGEDFKKSLEGSKGQGVCSDYAAKKAALPQHNIPNYNNNESTCEVLEKSGIPCGESGQN